MAENRSLGKQIDDLIALLVDKTSKGASVDDVIRTLIEEIAKTNPNRARQIINKIPTQTQVSNNAGGLKEKQPVREIMPTAGNIVSQLLGSGAQAVGSGVQKFLQPQAQLLQDAVSKYNQEQAPQPAGMGEVQREGQPSQPSMIQRGLEGLVGGTQDVARNIQQKPVTPDALATELDSTKMLIKALLDVSPPSLVSKAVKRYQAETQQVGMGDVKMAGRDTGLGMADKEKNAPERPTTGNRLVDMLISKVGVKTGQEQPSTTPGMGDVQRLGNEGRQQAMGMGDVQLHDSLVRTLISAAAPKVEPTPGNPMVQALMGQAGDMQGPRPQQPGETDKIHKGDNGVYTNTVPEGQDTTPAPDFSADYFNQILNTPTRAVGIGGLPMTEAEMARNYAANQGSENPDQTLQAEGGYEQAIQKYPTQLQVANINADRGTESDKAKMDRIVAQEQLRTQRAEVVQKAGAELQLELQRLRSESAGQLSLQKMQETFGLAKAKAKTDFQNQLIRDAIGQQRMKTKEELLQGFNEIDQQFDAAMNDAFKTAGAAIGVDTSRLPLYSSISPEDKQFLALVAEKGDAVFKHPLFLALPQEEQTRLRSLAGQVRYR